MRSAKYKFTSIVNSKGAKREVRNWTKSLLDKTVPGHFRFGQKILDIFVVTLSRARLPSRCTSMGAWNRQNEIDRRGTTRSLLPQARLRLEIFSFPFHL